MKGAALRRGASALGMAMHARDQKNEPPAPAGAGNAQKDMTAVPVRNEPPAKGAAKRPAFSIASETAATFPAKRTRRLLGLGEQVTLSTDPATPVAWSVTGGGSVSPATGATTTFTAPQDRGMPVVEADASGGKQTAKFTVIRPHGITSKATSNPGLGTAGPPNEDIGARTIFDCTVLPVSVSFDFAHFRENIPRQEFTWPDGTSDSRPAATVEWQPTNNVTNDDVSTGTMPIGRLKKGAKDQNFFTHIKVPEEFQDDAGTWVPWLPKEMHLREFIASGKSRVTIEASNNAPGTWQGPWKHDPLPGLLRLPPHLPSAPSERKGVRDAKAADPAGPADDVQAPRNEQGWIVDDREIAAPGQMHRAEFVEELDAAICATSREEMGRLDRSTDGCPLLEQWRPKIRAMGTRQIEISLRRWIGGDAAVRSARDYIPRVTQRLATSLRIWGQTGRIAGVPPDLLDLVLGGKIRVGIGSLVTGAIGGLFRKSRNGAAAPEAASMPLMPGLPLDGAIASRMGVAFGRDFSDVRVHTDSDATAAASRLNARAVTVGRDIAFAGGEYAPGTLAGDALLAHELAHVAQQDGAEGPFAKSEDTAGSALEHDADDAAVHAVASLWPGVRRFARDLGARAVPRLKSTLRLQACKEVPKYEPKAQNAALFDLAGNQGCSDAMKAEIAALYPEAIARVEKAIEVLTGKDRGDYKDLSDFDEQLTRHFGFGSTGPVSSVEDGFREILATMRNPMRLTFKCEQYGRGCEGGIGETSSCEAQKDVADITFCGDYDANMKDPKTPFLFKRVATSPVTKESHNEWVRTLIHEHAHAICTKDYSGILLKTKNLMKGAEKYDFQRKDKSYPPPDSLRNPDSYAWFAMEVSRKP